MSIERMIRFIGARSVEEKLALGEKPVLLDITAESSYVKFHPRSAVHIPLHQLTQAQVVRSHLPNAAREIVIFSEDYETEPAWEAAELLIKYGYNNIYIYEGGKSKWLEDGLPFQAVHYPPQSA